MPTEPVRDSAGSRAVVLRRPRWRRGAICAAVFIGLSLIAPAQAAVADRSEHSPSGARAMTQKRIDAANNAYNRVPTALEFITMSDSELSGQADSVEAAEKLAYDGAAPYFERISDWADSKRFDARAVIDNGDVVGANEPEYEDYRAGRDTKVAGWYRATERVMSENFPNAEKMFTQGNHDIAGLMGATFDEKHAEDDSWSYPRADAEFVGNFHRTVDGIDFIGLDYNGTSEFGYSGQRSGYQEFLSTELEKISSAEDYDPSKPIFVFVHSGYPGTSLGGPFHADYDLAGPDLEKILSDYPQAFLGSAHTHFSANPETSIHQKNFTTYENASMNYIYQDVPADFLGGGYFGGNQGDPQSGASSKSCNFISILKDGRTVIRRFDVTQRRWMGMPWVVDTAKGKDGFTYTDDKRSTTAPWWKKASISADAVTEDSLTLEFDQASDDELVNFYEVEITDADGRPVSFTADQVPDFGDNEAKEFNGRFKAYSRFYMTPNTMGFDLAGLQPNTRYTVKVRAYDDFMNESAALEGTVTTAAGSTEPDQ